MIPRRNVKKKQTRLGNFFFGGGVGGNKVHYGRCASGVFWVYGITFHRKKKYSTNDWIVN